MGLQIMRNLTDERGQESHAHTTGLCSRSQEESKKEELSFMVLFFSSVFSGDDGSSQCEAALDATDSHHVSC